MSKCRIFVPFPQSNFDVCAMPWRITEGFFLILTYFGVSLFIFYQQNYQFHRYLKKISLFNGRPCTTTILLRLLFYYETVMVMAGGDKQQGD